jgi:hypothetical protein
MAFALTDISIVVALGLVLVVVYVLGSYWKHRTLTRYAHWFEEKFSGRAKVQFASYGHAGLRVRCEMNDRSDGFREIYFAISLGARENLMYYPLLPLMHDSDRVSCWGIVEKPVKSNLRVVNVADKKQVAFSESLANMRRLETSELDGLGYVAYASNRDYSSRFLSQAGVASALKGFRETELIELDMTSSMIRLVSRLKEGKLPALTGFVAALGRAV